MSWLWLSAAILAELCGTLSLRASEGFRKPRWIVGVVAGYGVAFVFLGLTLAAGMPVGVAYGIWTAVGVALIAVLARAIWQEPLTRRMLVGIALIAVGVVLVEMG
ncbi:MAG: multidrug efflux SMR transporter [Propionibacterium sp.]|nr:multidrug efflux SMR transporter [Propionibacterium sp.]